MWLASAIYDKDYFEYCVINMFCCFYFVSFVYDVSIQINCENRVF